MGFRVGSDGTRRFLRRTPRLFSISNASPFGWHWSAGTNICW